MVKEYVDIYTHFILKTLVFKRLLIYSQKTTASCASCSAKGTLDETDGTQRYPLLSEKDAPLGPLDPLNIALQRIRELELELAQTKLAHVEAECKNQDLNHQLNTTLTEIQSSRNSSWQPWLSKTINTIQEKVATRRDVPSFQSYTGAQPTGDPLVSGPGVVVSPLQVIACYVCSRF